MRGGRGRGGAGGRGGGNGGRGGGGGGFGFNAALGADGDKDDPAFQHLRAMAAESRQAFRSVATAQRVAAEAPPAVVAEGGSASAGGEEEGAEGSACAPPPPPATEEPKPKKTGGRANFLKKLLPGLVIPASLPPEALPTPAFVDRTIDNFDFSREVITAARSAVVRSKHTRVPVGAVPPRPAQLPEADRDGCGHLKPWYNLVASTGCRAKDGTATVGPSLFIFAHADFAGAASLLTVACRNAAKCAAARALPDAGDESDDGAVAEGSEGESDVAGSQPAAKAHRTEQADGPEEVTVVLPTVPQVTLCMATETQSEESKEVQEALRFGVFMHLAGGGAWLWAALAAVHTPVHPDLDRDLHKLFQSTVKNLAVLRKRMPGVFAEALADQALNSADAITIPLDTDAAIVVPFNAASATPSVIRSLLSLLVVLGKVFGQANPSLMPL